MPVGHEALGHVGQHRVIAELVDVDAVTAAAIRVESARVVAQVRRDIDKPIARLLDGSLGRGVVAVDLIVRGEVRPGIDRRDRRDIQLCRRQLRLRIGKEAEVILAIGLLAGHVDVVHAHGEDPCYVPILGDSEGAGRMRLVRLIYLKAVIAFKRVQKYCFFLNLPNVLYKNFRSLTFI